MIEKTDVVIVGMGAAGGVAALPLTNAGLKVVGLEAGGWLNPRDFAPDVYTMTAIQLESVKEFEGFHGVNERILVEEYGRSIGFFYQLMDNLESL